MENIPVFVAKFIPTKEDFGNRKFYVSLVLLAAAVAFMVNYHTANLAAQVVAYIFGSIISLQAVFGLGKRVIRFVSVISGMIAVGMVLAIALMSISK